MGIGGVAGIITVSGKGGTPIIGGGTGATIGIGAGIGKITGGTIFFEAKSGTSGRSFSSLRRLTVGNTFTSSSLGWSGNRWYNVLECKSESISLPV
jgi:hypothetical protein